MKYLLSIFILTILVSPVQSANDTNAVFRLLDRAAAAADSSDFAKAKEYANEGIRIAKAIGFDKGQRDGYYELGRTEYLAAEYPASLEHYFKSRIFDIRLGDRKEELHCLNAIGMVYYALEDFHRSIAIFRSSLAGCKDSSLVAASYAYLAGNYFNLQNYDSSMYFYQQAIAIYKKNDDRSNVIMCQQNIAGIYSRKGESAKALQIAQESLETSLSTKDPAEIGYGYFNLGYFNYEAGAWQKAITNYKLSLEQFREANDLAYISNCHLGLADSYNQLGDYRRSLEHYKTYIQIRDSTQNLEQAKDIARKEVLFTVEKQQLADSLKRAEKERETALLNSEKIKRQQIYTGTGIVGCVLLLALAFVLLRSNRSKQKANEIILAQKQEVESQKSIIEEKQKEIIDSINYARRIQRSLLPTEKYIGRTLDRLARRDKRP